MEFLMNNWYMILALLVVLFILSLVIMNWLKLPRAQQIANIKEWLLGAVAEAEKQLGGGTGQLKLSLSMIRQSNDFRGFLSSLLPHSKVGWKAHLKR